MSEVSLSKWHQEMEIFRKIKPCLILEGNILDSYLYPLEGSLSQGAIVRLPEYLHYYFKDIGYENIIMFDGIRGFYNKYEAGYANRFADLVKANVTGNGRIAAEFRGKNNNSAATMVEIALTQKDAATVVIMDFASRYINDPVNMQQQEIEGFTILMQASLEAQEVRTEKGILKNLVILLVNKLNDVPAWYYLNNPNVKAILLRTPSKEERAQLIKGATFPDRPSGNRRLNIDRAGFHDDGTAYINGPTRASQLRPLADIQCVNWIGEAACEGDPGGLLRDGDICQAASSAAYARQGKTVSFSWAAPAHADMLLLYPALGTRIAGTVELGNRSLSFDFTPEKLGECCLFSFEETEIMNLHISLEQGELGEVMLIGPEQEE